MSSIASFDRHLSLRRTVAPRHNRVALGAAALASIFLLGGIGSAAAANGLTIHKAWMRLIIKARPAGGYFTLNNNTAGAVQLTGASSPGCGRIMLHQTKTVNGIEKMLPVRSLAVPAHGKLTFAPGGYHLMCMSPTDKLVIGHRVPVTLKFAGGQTATADFKVEGPGGGSMSMGNMTMGK
jgi:copper(I)-binding protein